VFEVPVEGAVDISCR